MDLTNRTVVVTGGASGIGLAIAVRFLRAGSKVIVCGRREDTLREVQAASSGLVTHVANLATASERRLTARRAGRLRPAEALRTE